VEDIKGGGHDSLGVQQARTPHTRPPPTHTHCLSPPPTNQAPPFGPPVVRALRRTRPPSSPSVHPRPPAVAMPLRKACTVAVLATAAVVAAAVSAAGPAGAAPARAPPPAAAPTAAGEEAVRGVTPEDLYKEMTLCDDTMRHCLEPPADTPKKYTMLVCSSCTGSCHRAMDIAQRLVWPRWAERLNDKAIACSNELSTL